MVKFNLVTHLFEELRSRHSYVVFAESLTAGLISWEFSKIPGASQVFWGSFVVYNPLAKEKLLKVSKSIIKEYGVVSEECALSMAEGALKMAFDKNEIFPKYSLAVTGIAGPPSQFDEKSVGTVYIAVAKILNVYTHSDITQSVDGNEEFEFYSIAKLFHFQGDRNAIREQTMNSGLKMLIDII